MNPELFRREIESVLRAGPKGRASAVQSLSPEVKFIARPSILDKSAPNAVADYYGKFSPPQPEWREFSKMVGHAHYLLSTQLFAAKAWPAGCDPNILDAFPGVEMKVMIAEKEPPSWRVKWVSVGGKLIDGRCVALTTSDVVQRFNEYGHPFRPFDWGGALDVEVVDRADCQRTGLLAHPVVRPAQGTGCLAAVAVISLTGMMGVAVLLGFFQR